MSKDLSYKSNQRVIMEEIKELQRIYKEKSQELVGCRSFAKEQAIKASMQEIEVKLKVLNRKLQELSTSVG